MANSLGRGKLALAIGALAIVALVGVVSNISHAISKSAVELMDKQQAAWYDGKTVMQEDHKVAHWDWKKQSVNVAVTQKAAAVGKTAEQAELNRIDGMLNTAVGMLDDLKKHGNGKGLQLAFPPATHAHHQLALQQDMPQCFISNNLDVEKQEAMRRVGEAADNLAMAYPDWSKGQAIPGQGQSGEWRHDRGPPYVMRMTLFSGEGVDSKGSGTLVRRILGLKTAFNRPCDLRSCEHSWSNNNFLTSFDGPQFRFLYRNMCSAIVVPPLTRGAGPILSTNGMYRLHHYLMDGYNTLIVLGGVANVLFINQNVATEDGGYTLEPDWTEGPYEAQKAQTADTPFKSLSVTLPGPGTSVVGVKVASLPAEAISYYEAQDVSVVFEIPTKTGRIIYLGYDFAEPVTGWVHALIAATQFNDHKKGSI